MKKKMPKRKTLTRVLAGALSAVLIFTSGQHLDVLYSVQAAPSSPDSTTQTGYKSLIVYQVEKWNNILANVFEGADDTKGTVAVKPVGKNTTTVEVLY